MDKKPKFLPGCCNLGIAKPKILDYFHDINYVKNISIILEVTLISTSCFTYSYGTEYCILSKIM